MKSLDSSTDSILPGALAPGVVSASNRNGVQASSRAKGWLDNLALARCFSPAPHALSVCIFCVNSRILLRPDLTHTRAPRQAQLSSCCVDSVTCENAIGFRGHYGDYLLRFYLEMGLSRFLNFPVFIHYSVYLSTLHGLNYWQRRQINQ
jgi:hypothetical protein